MRSVASASLPTSTLCSSIQSEPRISNPLISFPLVPRTLTCSSDLVKLKGLSFRGAKSLNRTPLHCNSSSKPGPPFDSGDGDSRTVLDAFFLGKAVAEALNERIESAVGEFLSTVGRLQAEQQKQVQEFQEDVFERAKKAKEKAAREALETRGLVPKSTKVNATPVSATPSTFNNGTPASPPDSISTDAKTDPNPNSADKAPVFGVSNED